MVAGIVKISTGLSTLRLRVYIKATIDATCLRTMGRKNGSITSAADVCKNSPGTESPKKKQLVTIREKYRSKDEKGSLS
jgi:hypothetical protein